MAKYKPGDFVRLISDKRIQGAIMGILHESPNVQYHVFTTAGPQYFYETQIEPVPVRDGLHIVDRPRFFAALTASLIRHPTLSALYSLDSGHIDFIPHQFRPVIKFLHADRPRLLIADGVGVGKTIEAALILQELQARREVGSVLVICPRPLVAEQKWEEEMKRFNEMFEPLDGSAFRYCIREYALDGTWPEKYRRAILPYSLFDENNLDGRRNRRQPGLLDLDPPPSFDLVIVDEAHHIRNQSTYAYHGVKWFCDNAEAVVFLTATPVQMEYDDLFVLLNLLRPDLILDRDTFHKMAEPNAFIGRAATLARRQEPGWEKQALEELEMACKYTEWGRTVISENPVAMRAAKTLQKAYLTPEERIQFINDLESLHSFSNLISRTRRRDIGEFTVRKAITEEVPFTAAQKRVHDEILAITHDIFTGIYRTENAKFLMTTIRRQTASCLFGLVPMLEDILYRHVDELIDDDFAQFRVPGQEDTAIIQDRIQEIIRLAKALPPEDPKLERLLTILRDRQKEPECRVMVFSSFRHTLHYLHEKLAAAGMRVGLIYGDVPDEERRALRERFALPSNDADALDVLLFSEVGGEGLDYQFCDCMVNYDLPWNPMRIEQRIGRIDRNGQKSESVSIFNLVTPETVDYDIYQRCMLRIGVFKESIGDCEEILGSLSHEVQDIVENFHLTSEERKQKLQQLADNKIRLTQELLGLEEKQKDLFTLRLPQQKLDEELSEATNNWISADKLVSMVQVYLKQRLGAERRYFLRDGPQNTLRLSEEDRSVLLEDFRTCGFPKNHENRAWEKTLRLAGQWLSVTAGREPPGKIHLTPSHPLVKQAARLLEPQEESHRLAVSLSARTNLVPPGAYPFIVYQWQLKGEREDLQFRVLCANQVLSEHLMELLPACENGAPLPQELRQPHPVYEEAEAWNKVDELHHALWERELEAYRVSTRELIRYREGSLTASFKARTEFLRRQFEAASNARIRKMRDGELRNAEMDFHRRMEELKAAEKNTDILFNALAYGILEVKPEGSATHEPPEACKPAT